MTARTGSRTATPPPPEQPNDPAGTVDGRTFPPASPAPDVRARTRGTTAAEARAQARVRRSILNKLGHAARQAAAEYRRTARQIGVASTYYADLIASAEQQEAIADAWEAKRPAVPTIPERRMRKHLTDIDAGSDSIRDLFLQRWGLRVADVTALGV